MEYIKGKDRDWIEAGERVASVLREAGVLRIRCINGVRPIGGWASGAQAGRAEFVAWPRAG